MLFVDKKAVGIIEAKKEDLAHKITEVEEQTGGYAAAKLKWVTTPNRCRSSTRALASSLASPMAAIPSRVARGVHFHRPETMKEGCRKAIRCARGCST